MGRVFGEKSVKRLRPVVLKARFVPLKKLCDLLVNIGRFDEDVYILILFKGSALAAVGGEVLEPYSKRLYVEKSSVFRNLSITKKVGAKVPPALGPKFVHHGGAKVVVEKIFVHEKG
jgi:hypothetical protein